MAEIPPNTPDSEAANERPDADEVTLPEYGSDLYEIFLGTLTDIQPAEPETGVHTIAWSSVATQEEFALTNGFTNSSGPHADIFDGGCVLTVVNRTTSARTHITPVETLYYLIDGRVQSQSRQ